MDRNIALFCMIGSIAIGLITIVRTLILIIKKGLDNKTAFKIISGWIIVVVLNLLTIWYI